MRGRTTGWQWFHRTCELPLIGRRMRLPLQADTRRCGVPGSRREDASPTQARRPYWCFTPWPVPTQVPHVGSRDREPPHPGPLGTQTCFSSGHSALATPRLGQSRHGCADAPRFTSASPQGVRSAGSVSQSRARRLDPLRNQAVLRVTEPELAVAVGAPAPQGVVCARPARVGVSGADARPVGAADLGRTVPVAGVAEPELARRVTAPAPRGAAGAGGASSGRFSQTCVSSARVPSAWEMSCSRQVVPSQCSTIGSPPPRSLQVTQSSSADIASIEFGMTETPGGRSRGPTRDQAAPSKFRTTGCRFPSGSV